MGMTLEPVGPIDGEAVLSLNEAKAQLNVDGTDDDLLIVAMRDAAIDFIERYTARGLSSRAWRWTTTGVGEMLRPGMGPITAVTSVIRRDGALTDVIAAGDVRLYDGGLSVPSPAAVIDQTGAEIEVVFTAGYVTPPPALLAAVRMMLGHLYRNREAVTAVAMTEAPLAVVALCTPFRQPVMR